MEASTRSVPYHGEIGEVMHGSETKVESVLQTDDIMTLPGDPGR
jgi:hypothetical protein